MPPKKKQSAKKAGGKKASSSSNAASGTDRKAQLQERRLRALAQVDDPDHYYRSYENDEDGGDSASESEGDDDDYDNDPNPLWQQRHRRLYLHDRVVYQQYPTEYTHERAVVMGFDKKEEVSDVLPYREHNPHVELVDVARLSLDLQPFILRHKVGTEVVVKDTSTTPNKWMSAMVMEVHPTPYDPGNYFDASSDADILAYKCVHKGSKNHQKTILVPHDDNEAFIRKRNPNPKYLKGSTLQCYVGKLVCGTAEAKEGLGGEWDVVPCQVLDTDVIQATRGYFAYFVSGSHRGQKILGYIQDDTPDSIFDGARKYNARNHLKQAIRQRCSYDFLTRLVKEQQLDIVLIKDELLDEAMQSASHDALVWLRDVSDTDLFDEKYSDKKLGNHLLQKFARADPEKALEFFSSINLPYNVENNNEKQEEGTKNQPTKYLDIFYTQEQREQQGPDNSDIRTLLRLDKNKRGLSWLGELFAARNYHAAQAMFLQNDAFGSIAIRHQDALHQVLVEEVLERDPTKEPDPLAEKIINDFHVRLKLLFVTLSFSKIKSYDVSADANFMERLNSKAISTWLGDRHLPERIMYFRAALKAGRSPKSKFTHTLKNDKDWLNLAQYGFLRTLTAFAGYGETVYTACDRMSVTADRGEFVQPGLTDELEDLPTLKKAKLVEAAVLGDTASAEAISIQILQESRAKMDTFLRSLWKAADEVESPLPLTVLQKLLSVYDAQLELEDLDEGFKQLLKYRRSLFTDADDPCLKARLRIYSHLVGDLNMRAPSPLDLIQWRRKPFLKWMVGRQMLDLNKVATKDPAVMSRTKFLKILSGKKVPASMTNGVLLCIAAIEYDDLQSLHWLVVDMGIQLEAIKLHQWNVVHLAAYFGRIEILLWLRSFSQFPELVSTPCGPSSSIENGTLTACHVALEAGHLISAEILLQSNHSPKLEKSLLQAARSSTFDFIKAWVEEKERPLLFRKSIQRLEELVESGSTDLGAIMSHVKDTNILDISKWVKEGLDSADAEGPSGKSYKYILQLVCDKLDPDRAANIVSAALNYRQYGSRKNQEYFSFWGFIESGPYESFHTHETLLSLAKECRNSELGKYLSMPWAKELRFVRPEAGCDPLISFLMDRGYNQIGTKLCNNYSCIVAMRLVRDKCRNEVLRRLKAGMTVEDVVCTFQDIRTHVESLDFVPSAKFIDEDSVLQENGLVVMGTDAGMADNYEQAYGSIRFSMLVRDKLPAQYDRIYAFMVAQGYQENLDWSLGGNGEWTSAQELAAARFAAFMGSDTMSSVFFSKDKAEFYKASPEQRLSALLLGAVESRHLKSARHFMLLAKSYGIDMRMLGQGIGDETPEIVPGASLEDETAAPWAMNVYASAVWGALVVPDTSDKQSSTAEIFKWLNRKTPFQNAGLYLEAACKVVLPMFVGKIELQRVQALVDALQKEMSIEVWEHQEHMAHLNNALLRVFEKKISRDGDTDGVLFEEELKELEEWLSFLMDQGIDMRKLPTENFKDSSSQQKADTLKLLESVQRRQQRRWRGFDIIKHNDDFDEVETAFYSGSLNILSRDMGGDMAIHVAAACNEVDILEWLVNENKQSLRLKDSKGRDVLAVAKAYQSEDAIIWIQEQQAAWTIMDTWFTRREMQRRKERIQAIVSIQSSYRGYKVWKRYLPILSKRFEAAARFLEMWGPLLEGVEEKSKQNIVEAPTWTQLKLSLAVLDVRAKMEGIDSFEETVETLDSALNEALEADDDSEEDALPDDDHIDEAAIRRSKSKPPAIVDENYPFKILVTNEVEKWRQKSGDRRYVEFFARRMRQLASGDRSRILNKRLTGSKTTIYETYLEQKSGFRILWTEQDHETILIWYIAKHKEVSRLMDLIDDSENRSARQRVVLDVGPQADHSSAGPTDDGIKLDPFGNGNTPLKRWEIPSDEFGSLEDAKWRPRLHLTEEEEKIVRTPGTVLLLGRSGTGKTVCICNRMEHDCSGYGGMEGFRQLFVARSSRLCKLVSSTIRDPQYAQFQKFDELCLQMESILPQHGETKLFLRSQHMDFTRFRREVFDPKKSKDLDALLIWKNIQSFLKGSLEALQISMEQPDEVLPLKDYLKFGKVRCRLNPDQRKIVYETFERYITHLEENRLWDSCDRILHLLRRLQKYKDHNPIDFDQKVRYTKVYIDEVQDYTQAEILFFFYMAGPNDLFFAGDTAQSVVESCEFRFEDIKTISHYLADGKKELVLNDPVVVNVNFRSHKGILDVAAAVLGRLFSVFPGSANQLKEDKGLFYGPRPGIMQKVTESTLSESVKEKLNGIAILVPNDDDVAFWRDKLGGYRLVYGIREAKGLEFKRVLILNYFSDVPAKLQKPWRDMLFGRDTNDYQHKYQEIESHLKLLYTAITRCIETLYIAETKSTVAGDAFLRWLTTTTIKSAQRSEPIGEKCNVDQISSVGSTPDEWRVMGLDNAIAGEAEAEPRKALEMIERALYCFENDKQDVYSFTAKARANLKSIKVRMHLEDLRAAPDDASKKTSVQLIEADVVDAMEKLVSENLLAEAKLLGDDFLQFLPTDLQTQLTEKVLAKLDKAADSYQEN